MMSYLEKLIRLSVNRPLLVIALAFTFFLATAYGLTLIDVATSYKRMIGTNNPKLAKIIEIEEKYSNNQNILVMFKTSDADIFTRETLSAIKTFTDAAWQLPLTKRVDSISNYQFTTTDGDELIIDDLITDPENLSDDELDTLKQITLNEVDLVNFLVSPDGKSTGINISFELDDNNPLHLHKATTATKKLSAEILADHPQLHSYHAGLVALLNAWIDSAALDVAVVLPIAMLAIYVGILWFFRSLGATLATAVITVFAILMALGSVGYIGAVLIPVTLSGIVMVLILAIADCVHVLSATSIHLARGEEKNEAIINAILSNFRGIALTSITTAIGFLSFNFSEFDGIKTLGNMVAVGVMFAFALCITLLPALLTFCKLTAKNHRINPQFYVNLANLVLTHRKILLACIGPVVIISVWLAQLNELDDSMAKFLAERVQFRSDLTEIERSLTGTASMLFDFDTDQENIVSDPDYMRKVDNFAQWFRQHPDVRHVSSYTDTMRRLNMNMNYGNPEFFVLPTDKKLAAQYLLLYEMSLPYGLDLTNKINLDKSGSLLTVVTDDLSLQDFLALNTDAQTWMQANIPDLKTDASGGYYVMTDVTAANFIEMLEGAILALVIISIVLAISLRSLYSGAICTIAVVAPTFVAFSAWALVVGTVGVAAVTVVSMVIGLTVDNIVHFMNKYLRARKDQKRCHADAIRYAFENVGEALTINAIALGTGFAIMSLSNFGLYAVMGLLTTITIALAILANAFLIPPLLMIRFNRSKRFYLEL